jgi:hypothetical protein
MHKWNSDKEGKHTQISMTIAAPRSSSNHFVPIILDENHFTFQYVYNIWEIKYNKGDYKYCLDATPASIRAVPETIQLSSGLHTSTCDTCHLNYPRVVCIRTSGIFVLSTGTRRLWMALLQVSFSDAGSEVVSLFCCANFLWKYLHCST